ncbi:MAG: WD40/YVTN/BNR-like repeat-containing protein [Candidatus Dormibacterales bacterium]
MTPDERDLRRALGARSAEPTPAYRARLSSALASGRPRPEGPPVLAVAAALILVSAVVGILVVSRPGFLPGSHQPGPASRGPFPAGHHASPTPTTTPTATPTQTPAAPPQITLPTTVQLSVPSDRVVWAFVAWEVLFRSADQGTTWERRSLPPGGSQPGPGGGISFIDQSQGWFMATASPATQCQAETVTGIWHTADGGASWQRLPLTGIGSARCKDGLSFADPLHGFMSAWDPNQPPVIYRSSDGGRTWAASSPLPDPPGFHSQPGGFELHGGPVRAFGSTLLVEAEGMAGGTRHVFVFRSTDEGASWTYLATAPRPDGTVAFATAARWLQLIGPGQSEASSDAGASWQPSASDYGQAAPVAPQVAFGSDLVGYATVRGGIQRSLDGGQHWSAVRTPGTG